MGMQSWLYPPKHENFLLAVSDDAFWAFNKIFVTVQPEHAKLEAQGDPVEILGKEALRIPLTAVQKITLDKKRANLVVHYQEKNKQDKWVDRSREFFIDDPVKRDEIVSVLRQRLDGDWLLREEQLTPLNAAGGHILLIVLTLVAIPLLLMLFHWLQGPNLLGDMGGGIRFRLGQLFIHGIQGLLRWLGFAVDVLIFLLAGLLLVSWIILMISQMRMPPLMLYLEKQTEVGK